MGDRIFSDISSVLKGAFGIAVALIFLASVPASASADVIIYEDFSRPDGTNIQGLQPSPTNLPGGTWGVSSNFWNPFVSGGHLSMGADQQWTISIADFGGYIRPPRLTISADISEGNYSGIVANRGVGVGFSNTFGGTASTFTGLRLRPDGKLSYMVNGIEVAFVDAAIAGYNANAFYNLSYTVDTSTGALSNIALQGSSADFSSLEAAGNFFTLANTTYAAFFGGGGANSRGSIDNFTLSEAAPAPEPASLALMSVGLAGIGILRRRRKE